MAQPSKPMPLSEQVLKTLDALSGRPGVEATLILSRKDGSVIKIKGSLEDQPPPDQEPNGHVSSPPNSVSSPTDEAGAAVQGASVAGSNPGGNDGGAGAGTDAASEPQAHPQKDAQPPEPTRATKLASEIFHFVTVSSSLACSMQQSLAPTTHRSERRSDAIYGSASTADLQPTNAPDNSNNTNNAADRASSQEVDARANPEEGDEVQLLRMRSKQREIIIYPDRKFLCCVIQNTERLSR